METHLFLDLFNFNGAFCICHIICYAVMLRDPAQEILRVGIFEGLEDLSYEDVKSAQRLKASWEPLGRSRKEQHKSFWPSREQTKTTTTMKVDIIYISTDSFCFKFCRSPASFLLPNARLLVSIAQNLQKPLCPCAHHPNFASNSLGQPDPKQFLSFITHLWHMMYVYIYILYTNIQYWYDIWCNHDVPSINERLIWIQYIFLLSCNFPISYNLLI